MLSLILRSLIDLFGDDINARLDDWVFSGREAPPSSYWVTHHAIPVWCHSHNNYTRAAPFHSAIKVGSVSVGADIWLSEDDLLVRHNRFTLHPAVTLRSLYLDLLLDILEKHNPRSSNLQLVQLDGRELAGVFANNPLWSPVTVVGSRVAPFQDIIPNSTVTDIFLDAPLAKLV
ncbi:hypothetical protein ASPCAL00902 [Aspergillus calidoustus]|uniref:Altered inheritance of mitochondria protein 6 n=1 Tax=Aspergillus calidoustus TaxID=454130 RepID=A0A0U5GKR6_ASPCI|nr:hypothetical protein ASPCAL00902 [Aspergillus calidoustus]